MYTTWISTRLRSDNYVCTVNSLWSPSLGTFFPCTFQEKGGFLLLYSFSYIKSRLILYFPGEQAGICQLRVRMTFQILDQQIKWVWQSVLKRDSDKKEASYLTHYKCTDNRLHFLKKLWSYIIWRARQKNLWWWKALITWKRINRCCVEELRSWNFFIGRRESIKFEWRWCSSKETSVDIRSLPIKLKTESLQWRITYNLLLRHPQQG